MVPLNPDTILDRFQSGFEINVRYFDTLTTSQIEVQFSSSRVSRPMEIAFDVRRGLPEEEIEFLREQRDAINKLLHAIGQ